MMWGSHLVFRTEHRPWGVSLVNFALQPGTEVEVRSTFDQSWKRGFVVESAVEGQGYLLRRLSDGAVLPIPFRPEVIRPASPAMSGLFRP